MAALSAEQCIRGINWGSVVVDASEKRLVMNSMMEGSDAAKEILQVPLVDIAQVGGTRTELQLSFNATNPTPGRAVLQGLKFSVPSPCVGFEQSIEAGKELQSLVSAAVSAAGGKVGNSLGAAANAMFGVADKGKVVANFTKMTISQPNGVFDITLTTTVIVLVDTKKAGVVYTIPLTNVIRLFRLPIPGTSQAYMAIILSRPIRVGSSDIHNIVFGFSDSDIIEDSSPLTLSMTDDEITTHFGEGSKKFLSHQMSGPTLDVLCKLFRGVTDKPLTGENDEFQSKDSGSATGGSCCMRGQLKGTEGLLYVLKSGLIFLHRPATFIPYSDIIEAKVDASSAGITFSLAVTVSQSSSSITTSAGTKNGSAFFAFGGLKTADRDGLLRYMAGRVPGGDKVVTVVSSNKGMSEKDDDGDEEDEESDEDYDENDDSEAGSDSDDSDVSGKKEKKSKKEKKDKSDKKEKKDKSDKKEKKDKSDKKEKKDKSDKKEKKDKSDKKEKKDKSDKKEKKDKSDKKEKKDKASKRERE